MAPSHDIGYSPEVVHTTESELGRVHVEVDHRVHRDGDAVPGEDLEAGGEGGNIALVNTSCGGTSKETVLMSTDWKLSMQGRTKKSPGP